MVELVGNSSVASKGRLPTRLRTIGVRGNQIQLEDGNWYTDWPMGLHGAIYGYMPKWWVTAMQQTICQTATVPSRDEQIVAGMLARFYPDVEAVRFMCTGSDPCAAAAKLARAVTGRDKLLVYGYHGSASCYCTPPEVSGTPIDMRRGTLKAEREAFIPLNWEANIPLIAPTTVAAVVVEVPSQDGPHTGKWLQALALRAKAAGVLFVLDEVKTAFRYGPAGAAGYYGLTGMVDLYCFGKTLGNGYPISCLAGKMEIMQELTRGVHYSGTFFAEPMGLAAAKATLQHLTYNPPWDWLYSVGESLIEKWNKAVKSWKLYGHPTRPVLSGEDLDCRKLLLKGHVVLPGTWYITTETTGDHINSLLEAMA